jgi:hypothetical protein
MQPPPSVPDQNPAQDGPSGPPDERPLIVVHSSEDLVAAVPYLVGFPPEQSLVVIAMRGGGRRQRLGMVARFDLPPVGPRRGRGEEGSAGAIRALVGQVVDVLSRDAPEGVVVLVYDDQPCAMVPVWQRLVTRLQSGFRGAGVQVMDALHVSGARFRSYRCTDPGCCPPEGRPLDPQSSVVAAEFVARGSSPMASRAALHALVQPRHADTCAEVEAAAGAELARLARADRRGERWRSWQAASIRLVHEVSGRYLAGESGIDAQEAGRLLAGLSDLPVRDAACLAFTSWVHGQHDDLRAPAGAEPVTRMNELLAELPDRGARTDDRRSSVLARDEALDRFWLDLATSCDGQLAVAPLTLLGVHVWSQGHGALALAATQRALAIDPHYRLAGLLDRALFHAIRPGAGEPGRYARRVS